MPCCCGYLAARKNSGLCETMAKAFESASWTRGGDLRRAGLVVDHERDELVPVHTALRVLEGDPRLERGRRRGVLGRAGSGDGGDVGDRDRCGRGGGRGGRRRGHGEWRGRGQDQRGHTEIDSCRFHDSPSRVAAGAIPSGGSEPLMPALLHSLCMWKSSPDLPPRQFRAGRAVSDARPALDRSDEKLAASASVRAAAPDAPRPATDLPAADEIDPYAAVPGHLVDGRRRRSRRADPERITAARPTNRRRGPRRRCPASRA